MPFDNFNFITDRLATGGGPVTPDDIQYLIDCGITHIIDCRVAQDPINPDPSLNLKTLYNPTEDDGQPKPVGWFFKSLDFALPALIESVTPTKPLLARIRQINRIYAHCDAGINRGPSTAYAILRAWTGMSSGDAKALIILHRPQDAVGLRYAPDADLALQQLGFIS